MKTLAKIAAAVLAAMSASCGKNSERNVSDSERGSSIDEYEEYELTDEIKASFFNAVKEKAEQGDAEAQNSIGLGYFWGDGVAMDRAEAIKWYRKAAEQGFAAA